MFSPQTIVLAMVTYAMNWLLSCALLAAVAAVGLVLRRRGSRLRQLAAMMPGPTPAPLLGNAAILACSHEELMPKLSGMLKQYGDVVRLWLGQELNVMVADPDDLKMLLASPKNSVKGPSYRFMAEHIGGGILSGSGHAWRRHRKLASPNYGKRAIESYEGVFLRESSLLVERLRQETGRELDVYLQIVKTTSYSVCQTLMALSKEETMNLPHLHQLIDMTERFYTAIFTRMTKWWYQFYLFYRFTGTYAFMKKFHKIKREFSGAILENRKRALCNMDLSRANLDTEEDSLKNTELGVIDRLILSNELTSEELLQETYTIFTSNWVLLDFQSQETSAKIASFILLMLAYHPEYQERLHSEIVSLTCSSGQVAPLTANALRHMKYLDCVFKECMRLFPIGAVIQRTIPEEFKISTHTLPAGCSLVAPIYQLSRDPRYWEHSDDFYPDHFSPKSVAARPANSYLPFSVGPMDCLGRYFGTKLIKMLVVDVVREFRLTSIQTYKDLRLKVAVSMTPTDGFRLILHPRN